MILAIDQMPMEQQLAELRRELDEAMEMLAFQMRRNITLRTELEQLKEGRMAA